jgi:hypothetical protein
MSDGRIAALISSILPGGNRGNAARVDVVSVPPDLQKAGNITGQVAAVKDGKVTIQTEQGPVILQTDLALQVGQKINIKLQVVVQNANTQLVADLSVVADPKIKPTQQQAPPQQPQPVELSDLAQDYNVAKTPVQTVDAKTIALPQVLNDQDLENLVRTVLNLSPLEPLPPPVQEGLDKLKILLPLLNATLQIPQQTTQVQAPSPVLTALLQLFQSGQKSPQVQDFFNQLSAHPLLLLQQITPGQPLSGDTLRVIKEQITILQQQLSKPAATPAPAQTPAPVSTPAQTENTKIPAEVPVEVHAEIPVEPPVDQPASQPVKTNPLQNLSALIDKIKPNLPNIPFMAPAAAPVPAEPPEYQPLLGIVLGQTNATATPEKIPVLLFLLTASGQNVLSLSTLQTAQTNNLPLLPGSVILAAVDPKATLTALPELAQLVPVTPDMIKPLQLSLPNENWAALDKLWESALAQQVTHPAVMAMMQQTIPTPVPQQMPAAALFFFAALKSGFLANWLGGETMDTLPIAQKNALIAQLTRDMQAIQNTMNDNLPADAWRPLPMPLNVNDQLMRLQWFYRHQYDLPKDTPMTEEERRRHRKTRFLVDVPTTKFGDLQIDGLVQEKTLDVILRTERDLRDEMQKAIRQRYHVALETSGFAGGLIFQAGREHYVPA